MTILRTLLFRAARHLASDERVQRKAAETYQEQVKPRADTVWQAAKPRIDEARADIGTIAKETDPRKHPARFAGRATRRLLNEFRRGSEPD